MQRSTLAAIAVLALACACGGGGSQGAAAPSGNALVQDLIRNQTSESAEPVDINGLDLAFSTDPEAFAGVLP